MANLKRGHIRLRDNQDSLAWSFNKSGDEYSAQLGYRAINSGSSGIILVVEVALEAAGTKENSASFGGRS